MRIDAGTTLEEVAEALRAGGWTNLLGREDELRRAALDFPEAFAWQEDRIFWTVPSSDGVEVHVAAMVPLGPAQNGRGVLA